MGRNRVDRAPTEERVRAEGLVALQSSENRCARDRIAAAIGLGLSGRFQSPTSSRPGLPSIEAAKAQKTPTNGELERVAALYGVAFVACALVAYGNGLDIHRVRLAFYTTAQLIAAVIMLIQDLGSPTAGFIKRQPMIIQLQASRRMLTNWPRTTIA
jgi:hypothetical protein